MTRRSLAAAALGLLAGAAGPLAPAVVRRAPYMPLVMLDPGHGGRDPGAIGAGGTLEKLVAFAAASELQRRLLATGRFRVELTRSRDVFIPLADRVGVAQARKADLFVSVHADALSDRGVRGASVYTLADNASDAEAAALARRENGADRLGGPQFGDQSPAVAQILASLVRQETRAGSARLSRNMVGSLTAGTLVLPNTARHANFAVLRATDVPSVLVEMGFLSNRLDEATLNRVDHRARVVAAMARGIEGWFTPADAAPGARRAAATLPGAEG